MFFFKTWSHIAQADPKHSCRQGWPWTPELRAGMTSVHLWPLPHLPFQSSHSCSGLENHADVNTQPSACVKHSHCLSKVYRTPPRVSLTSHSKLTKANEPGSVTRTRPWAGTVTGRDVPLYWHPPQPSVPLGADMTTVLLGYSDTLHVENWNSGFKEAEWRSEWFCIFFFNAFNSK